MIDLPSCYAQSRDIFLREARALEARTQAFALAPDAHSASALTTDVARIGPADARKLIVITSATHGVEGYAGAACQIRFMQRYQQQHARNDLAYLLVHAVNPWGYENDRRVTRENVDLNRNFIDFSRSDLPDTGYSAYHDRLVTQYKPMPAGLVNEIRLIGGALGATRWKAAQKAITAGQYSIPDGLFYGGIGPCESRHIFETIVATHVVGYDHAVLLDIHTGLGKSGVGQLISPLPASDSGFREMAAWFAGGARSMASGDAVSAAVDGTLTAAFPRLVRGPAHAIGLEFGTKGPLTVLNALRADQWCSEHGSDVSPALALRIRHSMKAAFAVPARRWCERVAHRFDDVLGELEYAMQRHQP